MRTKLFSTKNLAIALTATLMAFSGNLLAQRGMGRMMNNDDDSPRYGQCRIPNLTDEQEAKIDELRTAHLKEVTPLRNQLNEKRARLQTLESAEKADMNEINKTIDEIAQLKANIMKKGAAHRAAVASQLTDEQKVFFNSRHGHRGERGMGRHGKRGFGNGNCDGSGPGYGRGNSQGYGRGNW